MPRKGRIDYPGALHHVILRGINRAAIFFDDTDRKNFLRRLEKGVAETGLTCYAWALLSNHVHLLLRTNDQPLTKLMRCLLTGYALSFNRRHKRVGYLFQNRYKSILCEEDSYLKQLVRYIHLNPLRARLAFDLSRLNRYKWCGHSVVLGNYRNEWQDVSRVLSLFGKTVDIARRRYLEFVKKGIAEGKRSDLTGGGLIRSIGGWEMLKSSVKDNERWRGDERILGSSDFVIRSLKKVEQNLPRKTVLRQEGWNLDVLMGHVANLTGMKTGRILGRRRDLRTTNARALFIWWAVSGLGYTLTDIAEFLSIHRSSVMRAIARGEQYACDKKLTFT